MRLPGSANWTKNRGFFLANRRDGLVPPHAVSLQSLGHKKARCNDCLPQIMSVFDELDKSHGIWFLHVSTLWLKCFLWNCGVGNRQWLTPCFYGWFACSFQRGEHSPSQKWLEFLPIQWLHPVDQYESENVEKPVEPTDIPLLNHGWCIAFPCMFPMKLPYNLCVNTSVSGRQRMRRGLDLIMDLWEQQFFSTASSTSNISSAWHHLFNHGISSFQMKNDHHFHPISFHEFFIILLCLWQIHAVGPTSNRQSHLRSRLHRRSHGTFCWTPAPVSSHPSDRRCRCKKPWKVDPQGRAVSDIRAWNQRKTVTKPLAIEQTPQWMRRKRLWNKPKDDHNYRIVCCHFTHNALNQRMNHKYDWRFITGFLPHYLEVKHIVCQ